MLELMYFLKCSKVDGLELRKIIRNIVQDKEFFYVGVNLWVVFYYLNNTLRGIDDRKMMYIFFQGLNIYIYFYYFCGSVKCYI